MASLDSIFTRHVAAKGTVLQCGTDGDAAGPVALRIKYKGAGAVTSVTVTTATNIVFVANGVTQTYPFAAGLTLNTVAKLVAAINVGNCTEAAGGALWEAKALDTLPSYATTSQFRDGAITSTSVDGVTVWDVRVDTDVAKYFALRLTSDRAFNNIPSGNRRVHLQEFVYYATLGGAAADKVQVWDVKGAEENQVYGQLSVSATKTTENWASGYGYLTAEEGHDLVVILKDAVSLANSADNFLYVAGLVE
jgi:hypothetical protein